MTFMPQDLHIYYACINVMFAKFELILLLHKHEAHDQLLLL
jgi:hypothetical protein